MNNVKKISHCRLGLIWFQENQWIVLKGNKWDSPFVILRKLGILVGQYGSLFSDRLNILRNVILN
jgi:hypothetical protein